VSSGDTIQQPVHDIIFSHQQPVHDIIFSHQQPVHYIIFSHQQPVHYISSPVSSQAGHSIKVGVLVIRVRQPRPWADSSDDEDVGEDLPPTSFNKELTAVVMGAVTGAWKIWAAWTITEREDTWTAWGSADQGHHLAAVAIRLRQ